MIKSIFACLAVAAAVCFSGCSTYHDEATIIKENERAATRLYKGMSRSMGASGRKIVVTSLVNINDVESSCELGRISSEQIANRLSQYSPHVRVAELKAGKIVVGDSLLSKDTVFVDKRTKAIRNQDAGEFFLSRQVTPAASVGVSTNAPDYTIVVAGTYSVGEESVMVSLKAVDLTRNLIVSSCNYKLPLLPTLVFPLDKIDAAIMKQRGDQQTSQKF